LYKGLRGYSQSHITVILRAQLIYVPLHNLIICFIRYLIIIMSNKCVQIWLEIKDFYWALEEKVRQLHESRDHIAFLYILCICNLIHTYIDSYQYSESDSLSTLFSKENRLHANLQIWTMETLVHFSSLDRLHWDRQARCSSTPDSSIHPTSITSYVV
jgi:hypothetical protein